MATLGHVAPHGRAWRTQRPPKSAPNLQGNRTMAEVLYAALFGLLWGAAALGYGVESRRSQPAPVVVYGRRVVEVVDERLS